MKKCSMSFINFKFKNLNYCTTVDCISHEYIYYDVATKKLLNYLNNSITLFNIYIFFKFSNTNNKKTSSQFINL